MKRPSPRLTALVTLLGVLLLERTTNAGSQVTKGSARQSLHAFEKEYGKGWTIEWDEAMGVVRAIFGGGGALTAHELATRTQALNAARSMFLKHGDVFGLHASELSHGEATNVDQHWYVEFKQHYRAIPVADLGIRVHISHGALVSVDSNIFPAVD